MITQQEKQMKLQISVNKVSATTPINIRWSRNRISGSENFAEGHSRQSLQDTGGTAFLFV